MGNKYIKKKAYNSILQIEAMKSKYSNFNYFKKGKNEIIFTGELMIKPELPLYTVSICYRGSLSPIVKILTPKLVENPPHYYKKSDSLCLYHPDNYKWKKENLIVKDIVPWTIAWIYFYEYWLQEGEWIGPEAAHNETKEEENE